MVGADADGTVNFFLVFNSVKTKNAVSGLPFADQNGAFLGEQCFSDAPLLGFISHAEYKYKYKEQNEHD